MMETKCISPKENMGWYLCSNCYKIHSASYLNWQGHECESGNVDDPIQIPIDEFIAETIILLNQKGYITKACCSGHLYEDIGDSSGYIMFKEEYKFPIGLPAFVRVDTIGSFVADRDRHTTIRWSIASGRYSYSFEKRTLNFMHKMIKLQQWASSLPDISQ